MKRAMYNYLGQTALISALLVLVGVEWLIPVYFWLLAWITITLVGQIHRRLPRQRLQGYLLVKSVRMVLSVAAMVVGCILKPSDELRTYLLTFVGAYLIYLIYDTWFFYRYEQKHPTNRRNLKHETENK